MPTNLPERQHTVLAYIALNGPATEYQLTKDKKLGLSSFVAHQAPAVLTAKGFLKPKSIGKARTGRTKREYSITLEGLFEVLKGKKVWGQLDRLVSVNEQLLPEYFGLWSKFKEAGADHIASTLLAYYVERLSRGLPSIPETIDGRKPTLRDWLPRSAIYPWEAVVDGVLSQEEAVAFMRVILMDEKAAKLYVNTLETVIEGHRRAMQTSEAALQQFKDLKKHIKAAQRVVEVLEANKPVMEKVKIIREDPEIWQAFTGLYPQMKNAKDPDEVVKLIKRIHQLKKPT